MRFENASVFEMGLTFSLLMFLLVFPFNLSAQSSVGDSFKKPAETQRSIVDATLNILEVCREINFKGKVHWTNKKFGNNNKYYNLLSLK